tara:strand:+ start:59 stop:289 length:231 start_codon:yes stop_codon:yes gene_type:complete
MANSIGWGKIYCSTEFGEEDFTVAESIPHFSSPDCFLSSLVSGQTETLALTIDDTSIYKASSTKLKVSQTLVTLFE